jgi:hypothetical protein
MRLHGGVSNTNSHVEAFWLFQCQNKRETALYVKFIKTRPLKLLEN